jgi:hypothetical protein
VVLDHVAYGVVAHQLARPWSCSSLCCQAVGQKRSIRTAVWIANAAKLAADRGRVASQFATNGPHRLAGAAPGGDQHALILGQDRGEISPLLVLITGA